MTWAKAAVVAALGAAFGATAATAFRADDDAEIVGHTVYFSLKDPSRENIDKLLAACRKYSSKHDGMILFACGERREEAATPISDKEFQVSQVLIFKNREARDKYFKSEGRKQFVAEGRPFWSKVRVFEMNIRAMETPGLKRAEPNG